MPSLVTNDGEQWLADRVFGQANGPIDTIAVGTGTTVPQKTDTSLETEVYRADVTQGNVSIIDSADRGQYVVEVILAAGTNIDPDTIITEYGLFASNDGVMVGRETFSGLEIDSGETARIAPPFDMFP